MLRNSIPGFTTLWYRDANPLCRNGCTVVKLAKWLGADQRTGYASKNNRRQKNNSDKKNISNQKKPASTKKTWILEGGEEGEGRKQGRKARQGKARQGSAGQRSAAQRRAGQGRAGQGREGEGRPLLHA